MRPLRCKGKKHAKPETSGRGRDRHSRCSWPANKMMSWNSIPWGPLPIFVNLAIGYLKNCKHKENTEEKTKEKQSMQIHPPRAFINYYWRHENKIDLKILPLYYNRPDNRKEECVVLHYWLYAQKESVFNHCPMTVFIKIIWRVFEYLTAGLFIVFLSKVVKKLGKAKRTQIVLQLPWQPRWQ